LDTISESKLKLIIWLNAPMEIKCEHPRVRVVAREEDAEYVECLECGEVFDSHEFRDMAIEGNLAGLSGDEAER